MLQIQLDAKRLSFVLASTLVFQLTVPALFPNCHLNFFVPFLVILFYQKPYHFCLWSAFSCGLFIDLLAAPTKFGLYATSFALSTVLLYQQRRNFFADSLSTLPLMTYLFSTTLTVLQVVLLMLFETDVRVTTHWFFTDLIYMPALDALYAFLVYQLPAYFFGKKIRKGKEYFT
jgi:rod shape-determining protein MreD